MTAEAAGGAQAQRSLARSATGVLVAGLLVLAAALARAWLGARFAGILPFSLFFPAILAAALFGGTLAGIVALALSVLVGWYYFLDPSGFHLATPARSVNLGLFVLSGALVALVGARLHRVVGELRSANAALSERELRYRTLFDSVSDGFALVEGIWAEDGKLADYRVLEVNPAMLRILNTDLSVVGRRQSEILDATPPAWLAACEAALRGEAISFEFHAPGSERWYEIRLSRAAENQLAQFVVDITDRKAAERRQSELFDELNHRVKNNLALVSSMLAMQGRAADLPAVREHLAKAVDRIQTIADVHASLYRTSSQDEVDFAAYLQDLCARLSGALLEDDRVRIEVTAEPAALPLDKAVSLGVVVNELVTNAAKHAYPAPARGSISVRLGHRDGDLTLSVSDCGTGLPGTPSAHGLGMRLVRSLVQQNGGTLDIEHHPGATFTITLPGRGLLPRAAAR
ncbi:sensor histidine kinase [Phenylobacterium hankyongense]|nr:histidine kinase dimerization/phosphoacceptor domain -containing protein [Phenylobacterium hankyongense]